VGDLPFDGGFCTVFEAARLQLVFFGWGAFSHPFETIGLGFCLQT
jgi:hypothetical protein